tara:strand:- start:237 stop:395 length:159 start_codon:yes stop_codon:yes gene_type:complete
MEEIYIVYILGLCIFIIYMENNYPDLIIVLRKKIIKGLKKYWKALKTWESGN